MGLPDWFSGSVDSFRLDAAGENAAVAVPGGGLFVSGDAGQTWAEAARGLWTVRAVVIAG